MKVWTARRPAAPDSEREGEEADCRSVAWTAYGCSLDRMAVAWTAYGCSLDRMAVAWTSKEGEEADRMAALILLSSPCF
jgi:hypothetical protein